MLKRFLTGLTVVLVAAVMSAGSAQDYPERPVQFIVPWSPGGGSDVLMRLVSNHVQPYLGAELPIINMPGVSGTVGLLEASQRRPNGYTVAQVHEGLLVAHHTGITPLNWDDFDPVASMTSSPQFLVVNASSPWQTFEEFVEHAKANPGEIRMGVTLGGIPHVHAAMIEEAAEIEFRYVGHEGTGERIRAVVGNNIDAAIGDIASALEFVRNGDLRFLATGSTERLPQTPEVPTLQELGYDLELSVNRGIVAPKGTPEERIAVLEEAFRNLAEDEEFIASINRAGGAEVVFRDSDAFGEYLARLDAAIERLADKLKR